jgi:hypothetical protein
MAVRQTFQLRVCIGGRDVDLVRHLKFNTKKQQTICVFAQETVTKHTNKKNKKNKNKNKKQKNKKTTDSEQKNKQTRYDVVDVRRNGGLVGVGIHVAKARIDDAAVARRGQEATKREMKKETLESESN